MSATGDGYMHHNPTQDLNVKTCFLGLEIFSCTRPSQMLLRLLKNTFLIKGKNIFLGGILQLK